MISANQLIRRQDVCEESRRRQGERHDAEGYGAMGLVENYGWLSLVSVRIGTAQRNPNLYRSHDQHHTPIIINARIMNTVVVSGMIQYERCALFYLSLIHI